MLKIRDLTVGFRAERTALAGVDLAIDAGSVVIVTGAAGSGKSTLLAAASGIVPKLIRPLQMAGAVSLGGVDLAGLTSADLFRRVGVVLQSVEDQVWDLTVEDLIAFPLENRGVARGDIRARVEAIIAQMGISRLVGRKVCTLSGGERRITALASALIWQPDLLVLDEPTTGLDPEARGRMVSILRELRRTNLTMLIAEQDLSWFDGVADRIVFLAEGRVAGDYVWSQAMHESEPYDKAGVEQPFVERVPRADKVACSAERPSALKVQGLTSALRRPDGQAVLQKINLTLAGGEIVGLIGPNGAGKTTLMRLLLDLQKSERGRIEIGGEDSSGWTIAERARRIGYVPQNLRRMFFLLSILDEVVFALSGGQTGGKAVAAYREAALELLRRVRLADKTEESPFALSNREQLMLALVCIEATKPSVVILDEPLIACDKAWRADVLDFIERCRAGGCAVLLVSHDLHLVDDAADRVLVLENGGLAFDGPAAAAWRSDAFARLGWPRPERGGVPAREARYALA